MSLEPIRLGSALTGGLIFQAGSRLTTNDAGVDEAAIKVLYAGGPLPTLAKGTPYGAIFDNGYLADSFLLDDVDVDYLEGRVLGGTLTFKRQNPLLTGRTHALISTDSVINYKTLLPPITYTLATGEQSGESILGFPEPTVTVKYNSNTQPGIGAGGLTQLYALPGSSNAQGFPSVPDITVPIVFTVGPNSVVSYYNGTTFVSVTVTVTTTFTFSAIFKPNPAGWQLTRLKSDPQSGANFWDCEEEWRNFYYFATVQFISRVPP